MAINKLTHTALRAAKPTEKPYKLSDGRAGLYLLVNPSRARLWWRFKYQFEGREKAPYRWASIPTSHCSKRVRLA